MAATVHRFPRGSPIFPKGTDVPVQSRVVPTAFPKPQGNVKTQFLLKILILSVMEENGLCSHWPNFNPSSAAFQLTDAEHVTQSLPMTMEIGRLPS